MGFIDSAIKVQMGKLEIGYQEQRENAIEIFFDTIFPVDVLCL